MGVDIRKSLFYTLSEKNWPLMGLEALGMNLEDIFITIVDQTSPQNRYERREPKRGRANAQSRVESEVAKAMVRNADRGASEELSSLFGEDDNAKN